MALFLRRRLLAAAAVTDTERLDWLEKNDFKEGRLYGDDEGFWAFLPWDSDVTSPPVEKRRWKPTIREAIDHAMKEDES